MKLDQIRRRVGQMFMIGFDGKTMTDDLKKMITDYYVGGIILFERNVESPEQIADLTNTIQSLSPKTPLFIAVDQEGGRVKRLHAPFTDFGKPELLTKLDSPKLCFDVGFAMAQELRAVGINYNLAPVVDINTNPENPIIGDRAYSSDPELVAKIASGFIRGLQRGGVVACAKHFPGHGDTTVDSHEALPKVTHTIERLKSTEWLPFERVIKNGVESVMTAHILNPNIDDKFPATLSKVTMQFLRTQLRFGRVIITDDLEMKSISDHYAIEDATNKAIDAGADIILICKTLEKQIPAIESVLRRVLDLKLPLLRIEESSERITKVRNRYFVPFEPVDVTKVKEVVGCEAHQLLAKQLSGEVTLA